MGWYEYGVAPGSRQGSAVLVAHRDGSAQQGRVFCDLGLLELGDKVVVVDADGNKMRYKVVASRSSTSQHSARTRPHCSRCTDATG